jgi:N-acetylmuramoyl-L-alanine amidase
MANVDIVIDPGHGGAAAVGRSTPFGVRGPRGTLEKDVTLALARRVAHHLGSRAVLTRARDVNATLAERVALARRHGARVFVSLHTNEGRAQQRGSAAFVHPAAGVGSRALARELQRSLARLGAPAGTPAVAELAVLEPSFHAAHTSACLLEVDYLSHPEGEARLRRADEIDRLGGTIAAAIRRHVSPRAYAESDEAAPAEEAAVDPVTVTPAGEPITSANITVGGKHFVDWFNDDFKPTQKGTHPTLTLYKRPASKFPNRIEKDSFNLVFDNCGELWSPTLTQAEFLGFACIIYNETGGTFRPISEGGTEKYMFEKSAAGKASYNSGRNRPAGDLLRDRGVLDASDTAAIAAWNSTTTYPDPKDEALKAAARECDFWKYRGRGLIQITWRPTYLKYVDPLLKANGYAGCDDLSDEELGNVILTDRRIYIPMVKAFFSALVAKVARADDTPPDWQPMGQGVSGNSDYAKLLQWRCETLKAAMDAAGWQADAAVAPSAQSLEEDQDGAPSAYDYTPGTSSGGADAGGAPVASAPDLLAFSATGDTMDTLRGDPAAYRQKVVDVISAFNGFGVGDRPAGRRAAYGDIIAWGEQPAMREALLQKTLTNSSCGLVIRSAYRLLGARSRVLDPPYQLGTGISGPVGFAKDCGAYNPASSVDSVQRGDAIVLYQELPDPKDPTKKLVRQHIFTIVDRDGDTLTSVDGGQSAPPGSGLDDGSCNGVRKRVRTFAADRRSLVGDGRPIVGWIDAEKLKFTAPIILPVRNPSGNADLPEPDAS